MTKCCRECVYHLSCEYVNQREDCKYKYSYVQQVIDDMQKKFKN